MSSRRRLRRRACERKVRYLNQTTAQAVLRRRWSQSGERLTTYRCPYCNGWHLAHRFAGRH